VDAAVPSFPFLRSLVCHSGQIQFRGFTGSLQGLLSLFLIGLVLPDYSNLSDPSFLTFRALAEEYNDFHTALRRLVSPARHRTFHHIFWMPFFVCSDPQSFSFGGLTRTDSALEPGNRTAGFVVRSSLMSERIDPSFPSNPLPCFSLFDPCMCCRWRLGSGSIAFCCVPSFGLVFVDSRFSPHGKLTMFLMSRLSGFFHWEALFFTG